MNDLWNQLASRAQIPLSQAQHDALAKYLDLLLDANTRMNLTRITDRAAAELHHIADSLTLLPYLPSTSATIADVGSGGGVPGIPIAIARRDCQITLIESTKKKAAFLCSAIEALNLTNVTIIDQRVEDLAQSQSRETFDASIARAVATLNWLAEWCLPLVKKGGKFLAMKGPKLAEELPPAQKVIRMAGGGEPLVHAVDLPGTEHHVIVEIPKIARADNKLPRPATQAKGRPIS